MKARRITFKNSVVPILLIASLLGVFFYFFFMNFGMTMNHDGSMGSCPFSPDGSICTMSFREHMSIWQNMFAATPQKIVMLNFLLLSLWLSIAAFIVKNLLLKHLKLLSDNYRVYIKQFSYISLIDPIQRAIYQGLITPKIF